MFKNKQEKKKSEAHRPKARKVKPPNEIQLAGNKKGNNKTKGENQEK